MGGAVNTDTTVIEYFTDARVIGNAVRSRSRLCVPASVLSDARRAGIRMLLAGESATAAALGAERSVVVAWLAAGMPTRVA